MSKTKTGGKTRQKPPRAGKRLGIKTSGGQEAKPGQIVVRQRGSKFHPGEGVKMGKDHTIFALIKGIVTFKKHQGKTKIHVTAK